MSVRVGPLADIPLGYIAAMLLACALGALMRAVDARGADWLGLLASAGCLIGAWVVIGRMWWGE